MMKNILIFWLTLFLSGAALSQTFPTVQNIGSKTTMVKTAGTFGTVTGFTFITNFSDTLNSNVPDYIRFTPGIVILVGGSELWIRNQSATQWVQISGGGGGGTVTAASNGTSLSSTTVVLGGSSITQPSVIPIVSNPLSFTISAIDTASTSDSLSLYLRNTASAPATSSAYVSPGIVFETSGRKTSGGAAATRISFRVDAYGRLQNPNGGGALRIGTRKNNGAYTLLYSINELGQFGQNLNVGGTIIGVGTGSGGVAFGTGNPLQLNTTGSFNIAIGSSAMPANTDGNYNIAIGANALLNNVTGDFNIGIGNSALQGNTADLNTAIGYNSMLFNTTGQQNTALGANALTANTIGEKNVAIGAAAMEENTTGSRNSFNGHDAGLHNLSGNENTGDGWVAGAANIAGHFNVAYGASSARSISSANYTTNLGAYTNYLTFGGSPVPQTTLRHSIAIGYGAYNNNSYETSIGTDSTSALRLYGPSHNNTPALTVMMYDTVTKYVYHIPTSQFSGGSQILYYEYPLFALNDTTLAVDTGAGRPSNKLYVTTRYLVDSLLGTVSGVNIYNSNGSLTGNRTLTIGSNNLTFTGSASGGNGAFEVNNSTGTGTVYVNNSGGGVGLTSQATGNVALVGLTDNSSSGTFLSEYTSGSTSTEVLRITKMTSGTPSAGLGGKLVFQTETSTGGAQISHELSSLWTDPTNSTRTSYLSFRGVNSGTLADLLGIYGTGQLVANKYGIGTFTGTAAYNLQVDASGNIIETVAGGTNIYNSNGQLLSNRTVDMNGKTFSVVDASVGLTMDGTSTGTLALAAGSVSEAQIVLAGATSGSIAMTAASFSMSTPANSIDTSTYKPLAINPSNGAIRRMNSWAQVSGGGGGSGTVTSVSFTGGLISVATATTTPALTVAGTSGGIPYFSSTSTWASSALLAANALMIGGGAGTAPSTTTTGSGVLTFLGTPSWTNFNSMITGTAPFWSLATGGTLTGTNTITASTNPLILSTGVTTGTGATAGFQIAANSLTTGYAEDISSSSITTGALLRLTSTSTAANAFGLLNVNSSGANANTARTANGIVVSVTNTNATSGTNIGIDVTATGATTANYAARFVAPNGSSSGLAILVPASSGRVAIGQSTANASLDVVGTAILDAIQTSSVGANSNFFTGATGGSTSTTSSPYLYLSASTAAFKVGINGSTASTLAANVVYATQTIAASVITEASSGTHPILASLVVLPVGITAGSASVTNTATIYASAAPSASGATNYTVWVDAGLSRYDGGIDFNGASSPIQLNTSAGTSGQLLTSAGAGATPTWTSVSSLAVRTLTGTSTFTGNVTDAVAGFNYTMSGAANIIFTSSTNLTFTTPDVLFTSLENWNVGGATTYSSMFSLQESGGVFSLGDINGDVNGSGIFIHDDVSTIFYKANTDHYFQSGTVTIANLAGTGTRTVLASSAGLLSAPVSDRSTKEFISPLNNGLETIMKLNPVTFQYRDEYKDQFGRGTQVGFIAQDIQRVLPNSVYYNTAGLTKGKMGYNEIDLLPVNIQATKELYQMVVDLKKELDEYKRTHP